MDKSHKVTPETVKPPRKGDIVAGGYRIGDVDPESGEVMTRLGWRSPDKVKDVENEPLQPYEILTLLARQGADLATQFKYLQEHPEANRGADAAAASETSLEKCRR